MAHKWQKLDKNNKPTDPRCSTQSKDRKQAVETGVENYCKIPDNQVV